MVSLQQESKEWKKRSHSLQICASEEARIIGAINDASRGKFTGMVFDVSIPVVDLGNNAIGLGTKTILGRILVVSVLAFPGGNSGAGHAAGLELGDLIFGANFTACRAGCQTLVRAVEQSKDVRGILHLQCWRCLNLCAVPPPGITVPAATASVTKAYTLLKHTKGFAVFSEWEMWNFVQIILQHMQPIVMEELSQEKERQQEKKQKKEEEEKEEQGRNNERVASIEGLLDMETNLLRAKGVRTALSVKLFEWRDGPDGTVYRFRVEDVETGTLWFVGRYYREFASLKEELCDMCLYAQTVSFPGKWLRVSIFFSASARMDGEREQAMALEGYAQAMLRTLQLYAPADASASHALRRLQNFLGVDKAVDCTGVTPTNAQRELELVAFHVLNDFDSPLAEKCRNFAKNWNPEAYLVDGDPKAYQRPLKILGEALRETESWLRDECGTLCLSILERRRPDLSLDQRKIAVRRCMRRQVEMAIYLPLRHRVWGMLAAALQRDTRRFDAAMEVVRGAPLNLFGVDTDVVQAPSLPRAVKGMRAAVKASLPMDQLLMLEDVALSVMDVLQEASDAKTSTRPAGTQRLSTSRAPSSSSSSSSSCSTSEEHAPDALAFKGPQKVSADDFIPVFTYVLAQTTLPQLVISQETITQLTDQKESMEETGYYMATLEAAAAQILQLADQLRPPLPVPPPSMGGGGSRSY